MNTAEKIEKTVLAADATDLSSESVRLMRPVGPKLAENGAVTTLRKGISLAVEPRVRTSMEEFSRQAVPYSIALDGRVNGQTGFLADKVILNVDHHSEESDRGALMSTCQQIFHMIREEGLIDAFSMNDQILANIYVNDCDPDVCLSVWLISHYEKACDPQNSERLTRLVNLVDQLDRMGGASNVDVSSSVMKEMAWVIEPYERARMRDYHDIKSMNGEEMISIIEQVGSRINRYLEGNGALRELDTTYKEIGGGDKWLFVKESGYYSRIPLARSGKSGFISMKKRDNGSYGYIISVLRGGMQGFPLLSFYKVANAAERIAPEDTDKWGTSNWIGGAPMEAGSKILPKQLEKLVNSFLEFVDEFGDSEETIEKFINEKLAEVYPPFVEQATSI